MDPNVTWKMLITALKEGNRVDVEQCLHALHLWVANGGFLPEIRDEKV